MSAFALMLCSLMIAACTGSGPQSKETAAKALDYSALYPKLWSISEQGPVIPGLADGMIPQGLAYWKEKGWLIVSNYMQSFGASTLMILDERTQEMVKRVNLYQEEGAEYTGHAGGVAVSEQHAWISSGGSVYRIPLRELAETPDNGKVKFADRYATATRASFTTYAEGVLWVGEFYSLPDYLTDPGHRLINNEKSQYNAWVTGYRLDPKTDLPLAAKVLKTGEVVPDYIFSVPDKIQGMAITGASLILSQSYGRTKDSVLLKYDKPDLNGQPHHVVEVGDQSVPVWFLDRKNLTKNLGQLSIPPMSEGLISDGENRLFVLFESGAEKYRATALSPMDRIRTIRLDDWNASN